MRKTLSILITLAALAFVALATMTWHSPASAAPINLKSDVLSVTAMLNQNCSATVIYSSPDKDGNQRTVLLTAKHCVAPIQDAEMTVDFPIYQKAHVVGMQRYFARLLVVSFRYDLALVAIEDTKSKFTQVAAIAADDIDLGVGDPVVVAGYPLALNLTVTSGEFGGVQVIDYPTKGNEYYRATADIAGGNSGGGLWRVTETGRYELIGVTSAAHGSGNFLGLFVPSYQIYDFLKTAFPPAIGGAAPAGLGWAK